MKFLVKLAEKINGGRRLSSFQLIIIYFSLAILAGAFLLMLPISSKDGVWTDFETALFTSVSAICVTGLVVVDTSSYWSFSGQALILLLIQVGGIGVVSAAAFFSTFSKRRMTLLQRRMLQESVSAYQLGGVEELIRFVVFVTLTIETIGAVCLLPGFYGAYRGEGIWMAIFHSVSAFCNAGFDIMGEKTGYFSSLVSFASDIKIILPISLLIIIGGIGFLTLEDVLANGIHFKRYKMQSKVIIVTTFILLVAPTLYMFFFEFETLPLKERLSLSFFQSVTPRTAGFNTANISLMSTKSQTVIMILMLVGGSPGSTAGGVKTTTIAVLFANLIAVTNRSVQPKLFKRRLEDSSIKDASAILLLYLLLVLLSAFFISLIESLPLKECLFETISSIGTVGLSLGITPSLGLASHLILIFLMFFGRVGALTLMYAASGVKEMESSRYPFEAINIG
ncbi:MAG: Trk family potassium uptake protein [Sphaerochaetaceae bacterium]|nr:Trk family potassium uptake protein [Sphaerochaetaceae bacterium]